MKEMIKVIHGRTQRKIEQNRSVRSALKGGTWYLTGAVASLVTLSRKQEASIRTKPLPNLFCSVSTEVILKFLLTCFLIFYPPSFGRASLSDSAVGAATSDEIRVLPSWCYPVTMENDLA